MRNDEHGAPGDKCGIPRSEFPFPYGVAGPDDEIVIHCQCSLVRNLADFPFPLASSPEERRAVEERVRAALDRQDLLARGEYRRFVDLAPVDVRILAERRLVPFDTVNHSSGAVYLAHDRPFSVTVNGSNHLCFTMLGKGLCLQQLWTDLTRIDDAFAEMFDYAFDKRFGYLTASLAHTGTGLKAAAVLHLPALAMANTVAGLAKPLRENRQVLQGMKPVAPPLDRDETRTGEALYSDLNGDLYGDVSESVGSLFLLANKAAIGESEEELLFHLRQSAAYIVEKEHRTREALRTQEPLRLEDRVARALGLARSVRLLGLAEALQILSSLRLGLETGLLRGYSRDTLDELFYSMETAHLQKKHDDATNEWMLNARRADLFRAHLAQHPEDNQPCGIDLLNGPSMS